MVEQSFGSVPTSPPYGISSNKGGRQPYRAPTLTVYGTLAELTGSTGNDLPADSGFAGSVQTG